MRPLTAARCALWSVTAVVWLALIRLAVAFLGHELEWRYVAEQSRRDAPWYYRLAGVWGGSEGSLLLFAGVLAAVASVAAWRLRRPAAIWFGTLTVVAATMVDLLWSSPFGRLDAPAIRGFGLTPILEHPAMAVHPPLLYIGLACTLAAAMVVLGGGSPSGWLRASLAVVTLAMALGALWSYVEQGWGGYWAWDPVENASLLPWLTAIAAVHSAIVLERKGTLRAWTVVLITISFLLTILGTFLTRSGVVNSVHSFTQSPIGPLFLGFLAVTLVAVVILLSARVDKLASPPTQESFLAREGAFLVNNLLLVAFMLTVLIGTLFPIIAEAIRDVKVSVGGPYYDRMTIPMSLGLLFLLGLGPALPWGRTTGAELRRALLEPLPLAAVAAAIAWLAGARSGMVLFVTALAGFTLWVTGRQLFRPAAARRAKGEALGTALATSAARAPRWYGGYISHLGFVITFVAIAVSSTYQKAHEASLANGETLTVGRYALTLTKVEGVEAAHRSSQRALFSVTRSGEAAGSVAPALNFYPSQREPIGTPAVQTRWSEDLYVTLMSVERDGRAGVRAIVTPAVAWIWGGVLVIVAGMALCLLDGPRRKEIVG